MTILFASCTSTANEISEDYDSALESTTSTTSSSTTSTTTTTIPKNRLQLFAYESYGESGKEYLVTGTYGTKDVYITGQDELLIGYTYGENKDKDFVIFNDCKMLFGHQMYGDEYNENRFYKLEPVNDLPISNEILWSGSYKNSNYYISRETSNNEVKINGLLNNDSLYVTVNESFIEGNLPEEYIGIAVGIAMFQRSCEDSTVSSSSSSSSSSNNYVEFNNYRDRWEGKIGSQSVQLEFNNYRDRWEGKIGSQSVQLEFNNYRDRWEGKIGSQSVQLEFNNYRDRWEIDGPSSSAIFIILINY
jgi:hypothetical protein